jgi:thioredoxin reductase (NADPH)
MFPVMDAMEISRIGRLGQRRTYPAGSHIFSTGEVAPGAFILLSGQVDIMSTVPRW